LLIKEIHYSAVIQQDDIDDDDDCENEMNICKIGKRAFLDENLKQKKRRIQNDFGGFYELLNTPLKDLDIAIINEEAGVLCELPICARDFLLEKQKKYVSLF